MLGVDMFPSLTVGPQRIGDCLYREREAPSNIQLFPPVCDVAPRLLGPPPVPVKPISKPQQDHVKMELENSSLWKQFSSVGTEMIITKKGRRMFPGLKLKLSGLNPSLRYILLLDIVPVDNSRYRFQGGGWQAIGGAEARLPDRAFIHPDSPATGEHWQSRSISFHSAKLTNNTLDTQGHIILHSMHRYQPRIHLIEAGDVLRRGGGQHTFVFPETQFITVTAYQNNKITELKINSNPFAKGFRDDGMNSKRQRDARQKRKLANLTETLDIVNCDECESSESATTSSDLQTLALHSLLPDTSCGFRPEDVSYQVPEQSLDYGQPFMTSQMSNISISMSNEMQETPGNEGTNDMIEGSATMIEATYESDFSAVQSNSSSFPSAPLPQSSPSFSMLPDPSHPLSSFPPVDYPSLIPATPSLQQTSFTFPTPPLSDSSSPQLSPSSPAPSNTYTSETATSHASTSFHTPSNTYQATLQDPVSSDSPQTPSSQLLQGDPLTTAAFIYPNLLTTHTDPAPAVAQTPINQHQQPSSTISASNSLSFPSVPPHIQSLSLPSVSPSPALNLPNLSHQAAASFPPPSFSHSSTSFHHLSFPPSSCLQQCVTPAAPQNLPNPSTSSYTCPYPPVEISAIHQFNPAASYRPEMVLHSQNLLPRLPSSTPPSALYPTFPSYPLHLHQDPHSSLSNPFRHLYRQPQHGNHPSQGSFISTRAVF